MDPPITEKPALYASLVAVLVYGDRPARWSVCNNKSGSAGNAWPAGFSEDAE
ncbi:hypothetical protein K2X85_00835 [bacterium]|nr:hypothetical protein [bacterium]